MAISEPATQKNRTIDWIEADKRSPRFGQYVMYRTADYQALGSYERPGEWRFADGGKEENPGRAWQPVN